MARIREAVEEPWMLLAGSLDLLVAVAEAEYRSEARIGHRSTAGRPLRQLRLPRVPRSCHRALADRVPRGGVRRRSGRTRRAPSCATRTGEHRADAWPPAARGVLAVGQAFWRIQDRAEYERMRSLTARPS